MKIVFTAKISKAHQEDFRNQFPQHDFYFFSSTNDAVEEMIDGEVLVTYGEDLSEDTLLKCKKLKWIQVLTAGVDKMPLDYLSHSSIQVTNVKGIHKIPMAEYAFAAMLQMARNLNITYEKQQQGIWEWGIRVDELYGKTLGIIGVGAIGEEIARRAQVFGMKVIGVTRSGNTNPYCELMFRPDGLSQFLPECDYIIITVPSIPSTYHIIGREELQQMKESAVIINMARGSVIDEEALIDYLQKEKIKGAVLDVFAVEPLPSNSPLWKLKNCIITPHVSGRSLRYMQRALVVLRDNLIYFSENKPEQMKNQIDCTKGY